jgi:hypothetical protein
LFSDFKRAITLGLEFKEGIALSPRSLSPNLSLGPFVFLSQWLFSKRTEMLLLHFLQVGLGI